MGGERERGGGRGGGREGEREGERGIEGERGREGERRGEEGRLRGGDPGSGRRRKCE